MTRAFVANKADLMEIEERFVVEDRMYDALQVSIHESNDALGEAVAEQFAHAVAQELEVRDSVAVVLATGNSQLSFVRSATRRTDIDWSRVTVLHMDEYIGMSADHPASFRRWMVEKIVGAVDSVTFAGMRGDSEPIQDEIARYSALLEELDPAITVMGIGENGHLAFNDPPADFETSNLVHIVTMDETSRRQQVGEGHFASADEMPVQALTLTIPALLRSRTVLVAVPELRKAEAVKAALEGPITPDCPASILRRQPHARVFLDQESASLLSSR